MTKETESCYFLGRCELTYTQDQVRVKQGESVFYQGKHCISLSSTCSG